MRTLRQVLSISVLSLAVLLPGATTLLAKTKYGYFTLHVTPKEAYVYVDDVPLGWGSGLFWAVPGEHKLSVYNYGYKPYTQQITAVVGKTDHYAVALEAVPGSVSGPWGRIELKDAPDESAVLLNGTTPDFFVGHVGEFDNEFIWKQRLLVPPGNHQLNVYAYGGATIFSGPITVNENQGVIVHLKKSGEKETKDWSEGKRLTSLPRFKAGIASATVAVAKPTAQLSSNSTQVDCGGSAQLSWSTTDAPRVELSGIGAVAASGQQAVQPTQPTDYTLTAAGPGGTVTSDVKVTVNSNLQASLSVTPGQVRYHKVGDQVEEQGNATLAWSASGAQTATLDPFGSVPATGSRTVQPTPSKTSVGPVDETVTYTLQASNACGATGTATASLHVVGSIDPGQVAAMDLGDSIYFPTNLPRAKNPNGGLVSSEERVLDQLVSNLKQYLQLSPDAHLILEGHADRRGSVEYNMALSERRASRVRSYLEAHGINGANIQTKAFGKGANLDPATVRQLADQIPDLTPQDRKKVYRNFPTFVLANNRRVDIVLSTTGKKSLQYFPYKSPDLKELLRGGIVGGRKAHEAAKAHATN